MSLTLLLIALVFSSGVLAFDDTAGSCMTHAGKIAGIDGSAETQPPLPGNIKERGKVPPRRTKNDRFAPGSNASRENPRTPRKSNDEEKLPSVPSVAKPTVDEDDPFIKIPFPRGTQEELIKFVHESDFEGLEQAIQRLPVVFQNHAIVDRLRDEMVAGHPTLRRIRMTVEGLTKDNKHEFIERIGHEVERGTEDREGLFEKHLYRAALELAKTNKLWALRPLLSMLGSVKGAAEVLGQRTSHGSNGPKIAARLATVDPELAKEVILSGYLASANDPAFANRVVDVLVDRMETEGLLNLVRRLDPNLNLDETNDLSQLNFLFRAVDRISQRPSYEAIEYLSSFVKRIHEEGDYNTFGKAILTHMHTDGNRTIAEQIAEVLQTKHLISAPAATVAALTEPPYIQVRNRLHSLVDFSEKDNIGVQAIADLIRNPESSASITGGNKLTADERRQIVLDAIRALDNGSEGAMERIYQLWYLVDGHCGTHCVVGSVLPIEIRNRLADHLLGRPDGLRQLSEMIARVDPSEPAIFDGIVEHLSADPSKVHRAIDLAESIEAHAPIHIFERVVEQVSHGKEKTERTVALLNYYGRGNMADAHMLERALSHLEKNSEDYSFHAKIIEVLGSEPYFKEHSHRLPVVSPETQMLPPSANELKAFERHIGSGNIQFALGTLNATAHAIRHKKASDDRLFAYAENAVATATKLGHPQSTAVLRTLWKGADGQARNMISVAIARSEVSSDFIAHTLKQPGGAQDVASYIRTNDELDKSNNVFGKFVKQHAENPITLAGVLDSLRGMKKGYAIRTVRAIHEIPAPRRMDPEVLQARYLSALFEEAHDSAHSKELLDELIRGFYEDFDNTTLHQRLDEDLRQHDRQPILSRIAAIEDDITRNLTTDETGPQASNRKLVEQVRARKSPADVLTAWREIYRDNSADNDVTLRLGPVRRRVSTEGNFLLAMRDLITHYPDHAPEIIEVFVAHPTVRHNTQAIEKISMDLERRKFPDVVALSDEEAATNAKLSQARTKLTTLSQGLHIESGSRKKAKEAEEKLVEYLEGSPDKTIEDTILALEGLTSNRSKLDQFRSIFLPKRYTVKFKGPVDGETKSSTRHPLAYSINKVIAPLASPEQQARLAKVLIRVASEGDIKQAYDIWVDPGTEAARIITNRKTSLDGEGMWRNKFRNITENIRPSKIADLLIRDPKKLLGTVTVFGAIGTFALSLFGGGDDDEEENSSTEHAFDLDTKIKKASNPEKPNPGKKSRASHTEEKQTDSKRVAALNEKFNSLSGGVSPQLTKNGKQNFERSIPPKGPAQQQPKSRDGRENTSASLSLLHEAKEKIDHVRYRLLNRVTDLKKRKEFTATADSFLGTISNFLVAQPTHLELKYDMQTQLHAIALSHDIFEFEKRVHREIQRQEDRQKLRNATSGDLAGSPFQAPLINPLRNQK